MHKAVPKHHNLHRQVLIYGLCEMPDRGLSKATRLRNTADIAEWLSVVGDADLATTAMTDRYLTYLDSTRLGAASKRRKIRAVATFVQFLYRQGALARSDRQ